MGQQAAAIAVLQCGVVLLRGRRCTGRVRLAFWCVFRDRPVNHKAETPARATPGVPVSASTSPSHAQKGLRLGPFHGCLVVHQLAECVCLLRFQRSPRRLQVDGRCRVCKVACACRQPARHMSDVTCLEIAGRKLETKHDTRVIVLMSTYPDELLSTVSCFSCCRLFTLMCCCVLLCAVNTLLSTYCCQHDYY